MKGTFGRQLGFTLVELLVVVAIIVVLVALLVPAMDRAMLEAEMAICGSNQHAVGASVTTYAFDFRRSYPYRKGVAVEIDGAAGQGTEPHRIADWDPGWDDRPTLVGYLDINKHLNDPTSRFVEKVNTPDADASAAPEYDIAETTGAGMRKPIVFSDFYLWFGFGYRDGGNVLQGMNKLGDKIEWETNSFSLLVSDLDVINQGSTPYSYHGSHPDHEGVLRNAVRQDTYVFSHWRVDGRYDRPPLDLNFGYADGSVLRQNSVRFDDERVARLPHYNTGRGRTYPAQWANVSKGK